MRAWIVSGWVALAACGRVGFDPLDDADGASPTKQFVQVAPQVSSATDRATTQLPASPTAGNTIIVFAWSWAAGTTSLDPTAVTDNAGNTYVRAVMLATSAGSCDGGLGAGAIYVASDVVPGAGLLGVTILAGGDTVQQVGAVVAEYAGVTALDQVASMLTASGPSPYRFESGTVVATSGDELLASLATPCAGNPDPITWADNAGFTVRGSETVTNGLEPGLAADRIVTSAGAYHDEWTITFSAPPNPAIGLIASFR